MHERFLCIWSSIYLRKENLQMSEKKKHFLCCFLNENNSAFNKPNIPISLITYLLNVVCCHDRCLSVCVSVCSWRTVMSELNANVIVCGGGESGLANRGKGSMCTNMNSMTRLNKDTLTHGQCSIR